MGHIAGIGEPLAVQLLAGLLQSLQCGFELSFGHFADVLVDLHDCDDWMSANGLGNEMGLSLKWLTTE